MTQATPTAPRDTRPTVAGGERSDPMRDVHVLIAHGDPISRMSLAILSSASQVIQDVEVVEEGRIAALEAALEDAHRALLQVVSATVPAMFNPRIDPKGDPTLSEVHDILTTLGLAHRLQGNPDQAEQVTA